MRLIRCREFIAFSGMSSKLAYIGQAEMLIEEEEKVLESNNFKKCCHGVGLVIPENNWQPGEAL